MALSASKRLLWPAVEEWIQEFLWDSTVPGTEGTNGIEMLRLKALLQVSDYTPVGSDETIAQTAVVVQGVREMFDSFAVPSPDSANTSSLYKLVLIGRNLPHESLRQSWSALVASASSS
ncbi:hypothetical protein GGI23_000017 [Coemansia sp. RSA 2559]|nr:hypothetical protein GGI23_000017 [Coemansia sp. RSA 2559]KAJ2869773.1 hypothetical protein GGI22_000015 [Coemansia erecta]